jgi:hypothetical protein
VTAAPAVVRAGLRGAELAAGLRDLLGPEKVLWAREDLLLYEYDGAVDTATPDAVVANFYSLAQDKHFDRALALWDDHLKAAYPPDENLYQRFADTTVLTVNSASVTQRTDTFAIVATDLTEVTDGVRHHWVGQWRLIRSGGSWLLDQPDFQAA